MKWIAAALLFLAPSVTMAHEISVGGTPLVISNPAGYVPVTPEMKALYELQKQFVAPMNKEFVTFIPEESAPAAAAGEIPDLARRFSVQTTKDLVSKTVPSADFQEMKAVIKNQNDVIIKRLEKDLPGFMDRINQGLSEEFDVNPAFAVSGVIPFAAHEESDRTLAYSALVRYDSNDAEGNPAPFVVAFTATFVHVKGKILFLYCYADEAGLTWCREASQQWSDAVVTANPPDAESRINESLPSAVTGMDWGRVALMAVVGGAIGLVVGVLNWARKRK